MGGSPDSPCHRHPCRHSCRPCGVFAPPGGRRPLRGSNWPLPRVKFGAVPCQVASGSRSSWVRSGVNATSLRGPLDSGPRRAGTGPALPLPTPGRLGRSAGEDPAQAGLVRRPSPGLSGGPRVGHRGRHGRFCKQAHEAGLDHVEDHVAAVAAQEPGQRPGQVFVAVVLRARNLRQELLGPAVRHVEPAELPVDAVRTARLIIVSIHVCCHGHVSFQSGPRPGNAGAASSGRVRGRADDPSPKRQPTLPSTTVL